MDRLRGRWWRPEAGELLTLALGAGLGLTWLLIGLAAALNGFLGTTGSGGSWNVPGPSLDPLGLLRTLLLPLYLAFLLLNSLASPLGWEPGGGIVVLATVISSLGLGLLLGLLIVAYIRWGG